MNRKKFLKQMVVSSASVAVAPVFSFASVKREPDCDQLKELIGYNHLPNKEDIKMGTVVHRAETRGQANHGWLNSKHTFSFANYRNPERMNFGVLRVLNDDVVSPGKGFSKHPHHNMEIVSIPTYGDLEHKDSMGNTTVIKEGDIQVMSAGTGVSHSEYNKNEDKEVKFLQIWMFPNKRNVEPRYDQISIAEKQIPNTFQQILSPNKDDAGVWVNQNAWFSMGVFAEKSKITYKLNNLKNGVYLFVLNGQVEVEGEKLHKRDDMGIWSVSEIKMDLEADSKVLLMEVPMEN